METKIMKVSEIVPAEYNPRKALKPGDDEYEALKNSLERFSLVTPLVVNKTTGKLISGHQRLAVLKASGTEEVEVVLVELDDEKEKLANIALNKIEGDWDYKKLEELFQDISAEDIKFTGFTDDELSSLFDAEIPDSDDDTPEETDNKSSESEPDDDETDGGDDMEKDFNVYLSFPTKELAEKWMKDRGIDLEYEGTARNITIRMEGIGYGTGN